MGLDVALRLYRSIYVDAEVSLWIGRQYKDSTDTDYWTFALMPVSVGVGLRRPRGVLQPYVNMDFSLMLYAFEPRSQQPLFAVGPRLQAGLDVVFVDRIGFFVEGTFAFYQASRIDELVDDSYWPGWVAGGVRGGLVLQL